MVEAADKRGGHGNRVGSQGQPANPVGVQAGNPVIEEVADQVLGSGVPQGRLLAVDIDRAGLSRGEGEGAVGAMDKGTLVENPEELLTVGRQEGFPAIGKNGLNGGHKFDQGLDPERDVGEGMTI